MKGKLIKKKDNWYNLYQGEIGIGSTYEELQGYKLSLSNCQAIELGYDLDELARKEILYNDQKREWWKQGAKFILEILGDKKFSEENLLKAFTIGVFSEFEKANYTKEYDEFLKSLQPTEWDVTVEMEYVGECNGNNDEGCFQDSPGHNCGCFEKEMKLDANGCLILKLLN